MLWGYAGPWYGEFYMRGEDYVDDKTEQLWMRLDFLEKNGLDCMGSSFKAISQMEEATRERLFRELEEKDLHLSAGIGYDYLNADDEEIKRQTDFFLEALEKFAPKMRAPIFTTGPHAGHRFDRVMPLEEKYDRIAKCLAPLAKACRDAGRPLGIENHADYYISDMVEICNRAPGLGIFLDTGNCFMVGEKPVPAYREAAPLTIGTHFKDHHVRPVPQGKPMHFEVKGAALGQGDAQLRECWDILMKLNPNPEKLVMEMEMISPKDDMTPPECLEISLDFIRSLNGKG